MLRQRLLISLFAFCFLITSNCLAATSWNDRNDALGDWNGIRSQLENQYGLHFDIDYTAETFSAQNADNPAYRGNLDIMLSADMEKAHLLRGATAFIYFQNGHGAGISNQFDLLMPISNLEAPPFTQLSEFWLYQRIGKRLHLRLGKQDTNRDFGSPRFPGNFINSAYGDFPGNPMPSFPAPGLGAAAFFDTVNWLQLRVGVYEGQPKIGSFGETAFSADAGAFLIAAGVFKQKWKSSESLDQIGVWRHTSLDRTGVFGIYDVMLHPYWQNADDKRTVQIFIRAGWSPDLPERPNEITSYAGGGITAHAFLGNNNTIGLGFGAAHTAQAGETFIESFFKLRTIAWFTFEPDIQYYFRADRNFLTIGIRTKLKL